jgi:hypothetical protein
MAVQMHVAYSSTFKGAAIYAGAVYWCSEDSFQKFDYACSYQYKSHLADSEKYLDAQSAAKTIDPSTNLQTQPVYLWSGTKDTIVLQPVMNDLNAEYQHYGAHTKYDNAFAAAHGWESPDGENDCSTQASPFMIHCLKGSVVYDSEKVWLRMFLKRLKPRNDGALKGKLINFDQSEFGASYLNSMDTNGYVFVPKACAAGLSCSLVLALAGCPMAQSDIGTKFITEGGILPWADANKIVVLYPYMIDTPQSGGCWDVWGYLGTNYALKSGTQMAILHSMVSRITGRN